MKNNLYYNQYTQNSYLRFKNTQCTSNFASTKTDDEDNIKLDIFIPKDIDESRKESIQNLALLYWRVIKGFIGEDFDKQKVEEWLEGDGAKYINAIKSSISDYEIGLKELNCDYYAVTYNIDLLIAASIIEFGNVTKCCPENVNNVQKLENCSSDQSSPLVDDGILSKFFSDLIKPLDQELTESQNPTDPHITTKSLFNTALALISTPIGIAIVGLTAICSLYFAGKSYFATMNSDLER
ncbi:MAG: hypothetical protein K0R73_744 [Candidatus Midichloriaceae bacterium]|jgi:hypothetical protein|nr:hypothetical protein [Candidatus Midichloriaceae bacterium]